MVRYRRQKKYFSSHAISGTGEKSRITGLVASGAAFEEILKLYPYLEEGDIRAALSYAAWRTEEHDLPLQVA